MSGEIAKQPGKLLGKRRTAPSDSNSEPGGVSPAKVTKTIHPFFTSSKQIAAGGTLTWLPSLGSKGTCLHAINHAPKASEKVAVFDLDGTLIKQNFPSKAQANAPPHWEWWRSCVPAQLKEVHESGFSVVIVSNQAIKPQALKIWKSKIQLIAAALPHVPFRLFAATAKDGYRKPMPGMWLELERIFRQEGVKINKTASFFVGDAAGRQYAVNKCDFSSTDRKWALNLDIPFSTPEEYFLNLPPYKSFSLPGFHVSSLPDLPRVVPTSTPLIPPSLKQELVLFVGYPCLGKSTFYRRHFQPVGYVHVNQDTLKTREKCVKTADAALREGKSCIVDNTNRDVQTRKYYVDLSKKFNIPLRCFVFTGSIELAWHNNLYRAYNLHPSVATNEPERTVLPYLAFTSFRDSYEEPDIDEGFIEIKKVNWIFEGTEEERKYWSMWLQIDGK